MAKVSAGSIKFFPKQRRSKKMLEVRPPVPPFTHASAVQKVRVAEDGWNSCDPHRVSLAYTVDSSWRNRAEFVQGRTEIIKFLSRKWDKELEYRLIKELWAWSGERIAVRFAYEWHDDSGNWFRSYGNENWEFDADGLMRRRFACINDEPISKSDRRMLWDRKGSRPLDHPGLSDLLL
jgi:uncharacterized protein